MSITDTPAAIGATYLQLTVQMVNGNREEFVQSDPEIAGTILGNVRPDRLFNTPHITLIDAGAVTIFPTDRIERLELRSDPLPRWQQRPQISEVEEISASTFQHIAQRSQGHLPMEYGMQAEMRSGINYYLRIRFRRPTGSELREPLTADDTGRFLAHLFTGPAVFGSSRTEDCLFLLNPANVVRFTLAPPPAAVSGAWKMRMRTPAETLR